MKFHENKFLTMVGAAALALAVGACSSSSDDDEMAGTPPPMDGGGDADAMNGDADAMNGDADAMNGDETDPAVESLRGQLAAANARIGSADDAGSLEGMLAAANAEAMRLEGLLGAETDPAADSVRGMLAAANAEAMRLEGLLGAETDPAADSVRGMLAAANAEAMRLEGLLGAETDPAADSLRGQLAAANAQIDNDDPDNLGLMQQLAAAKVALAKIEMETEAGRNAMTLAERIARESEIQMAIATGGRVGASEKSTPMGIESVTAARNAAGMVTVKVDDEDYTGGETTAGAGDWNGATLTNGTNTLVVYTDIEAPSDKKFTLQYLREDLDNALTVPDANDKRAGKAQSAGFPSAPDTSWTYTGLEGGRAKTVDGTFDGVPGHFACDVETCTLMTDDDGKLMSTTEAWRFTPMAPLTATVKDPDAAYAYFGWWLDKPEDNTLPHMVEVFAGGTGMHAADVNNEIKGNATYKGPAAGKYATKTFSAGAQTDASVGHFTASTTLTAKFADEILPGTISGSVTGFELDDGTSPTWSVKLENANLITTQHNFDGLSVASFGPTAKVAGTWQGAFYDDADTTDPTNAPGTVAGTFDAVSDNATLIGGFGATKQ